MRSEPNRVTVDYAARDGGWIATARGVEPPTVAYARTLEKARENIAAALGRALRTYPGNVAIDDEIAVRPAATKAVAEARRARDAALKAESESRRATLLAAQSLQKAGLSLRDVAYVLGLSHARVHQIVQKEKN